MYAPTGMYSNGMYVATVRMYMYKACIYMHPCVPYECNIHMYIDTGN